MKVVTFGELMVRLQPYDYLRFVQADRLEFTFGGGEANVAVSLANYGAEVAYVTKLPRHAIGQCAVNSLRRYGVDTSRITRGGDRVGIYFNEKGAAQRPSVCITTARIRPLPRLPGRILTGTPFLPGWIGSTLPASPRRLAPMWWRSAAMPARPPKRTASRSAAI